MLKETQTDLQSIYERAKGSKNINLYRNPSLFTNEYKKTQTNSGSNREEVYYMSKREEYQQLYKKYFELQKEFKGKVSELKIKREKFIKLKQTNTNLKKMILKITSSN